MLIDGVPGLAKTLLISSLAKAMDQAHLVCNYNSVPGDDAPPFNPSGLRLGTPAITTRGFTVADCQELAGIICDVLDHIGNASVERDAKERALALCRQHPVYGD